jgi:HSP20 family protein
MKPGVGNSGARLSIFEEGDMVKMSDKSTAVQMAPSQAPAPAPATPLKLVEPETLLQRINQVYDTIARRAFEIFENGGGFLDRDLEHWFQAEAELLHPVHVQIKESGDTLIVQAEVPGFRANELEVSIEPKRLAISGKKESREEQKKGQTIYGEQCSTEILRVVELPAEVNTSKTTATLKDGVLEVNLTKAAEEKATRAEAKTA